MPLQVGPLSSQQQKLAIAPVVKAVKLVQDQDGLRKHGVHKPGMQRLLPQVMALVPRGPQVTAQALVPHGLPTQVLVLVPRTLSQVTALVAQAGAIKITTAVFNVCYSLKLLGWALNNNIDRMCGFFW